MQPSIVEETVATPGSLSTIKDVCSFTEAELDLFRNATLTTIRGFACPETGSCLAELTSVCGQQTENGRRSLSSRHLQEEQTWQVNYVVTETFTCELSTCSSASDTATISAISDSIATRMTNAIDSKSFVAVLSKNILEFEGSGLDPSIVICLIVWGIVNAPVTEVSVQGTGVFYPDWEFHSGTCLEDGNQPLYMKELGAWSFVSLEECCVQHFGGWNMNKCMNVKGSGLWYVSYTGGKCVTDCNEGSGETCGGLANPHSDDLFTNPRSCCKSDLFWVFLEFCEAESLISSCYGGTGLYYRGDAAGIEVCVRDCDPITSDTTCGGIVEDSYVVLHDTAEDCCSIEYDWIENELCAARTTHTPLDKYWPDMLNGKCIKDSETQSEDLDVSIWNSKSECCTNKIHWKSEAKCLTDSGDNATVAQGSRQFFIDWVNEQCIQDCEGPAPCGGIGKSWEELYETENACCEMIPWVEREECVYDNAAVAQGSGQFFIDWVTEQCIQDCEGPAPCGGIGNSWEELYETENVCCEMIPWVEHEDCVYTEV